jgi:hypothetical protein
MEFVELSNQLYGQLAELADQHAVSSAEAFASMPWHKNFLHFCPSDSTTSGSIRPTMGWE